MAHKKKRRTATGASPESLTQTNCRHSTARRPLPDDLPAPMHAPFRQLVTAAEAYIAAGGHLIVEASWWTERDGIGSAVLSDRDTATVAAVLVALSERDRAAVQA